MEAANQIEYKLRDLGTRAVTLFPTRAQIYRDIKNVPLQPGVNKITIAGLTPTVDKDSVKVEGSGLAVITDISVTKENNPEEFIDIYPEFDKAGIWDNLPEPVSDEGTFDEALNVLEDIPQLKDYKLRLASAQDEVTAAREAVESANARLKVLDNFSNSVVGRKGPSVDISQFMGTYGTERESAFRAKQQAEKKIRELQTQVREYELKVEKFKARQDYERAVAAREARRRKAEEVVAKEKEDRRKRLDVEKKARRRQELLGFWPKYVYNVCITLDANPNTPMSSRRNSTSSHFEPVKSPVSRSEGGTEATLYCDLVLSYVTTSAFWAPSYDMQLSTTTNAGTLLFDAQLHNSTSETWKDCHVTLSTSQATATSIEEPIPALVPWHIRLIGKGSFTQGGDDISLSKEERDHKLKFQENNNPSIWNKDRSDMFQGDYNSNLALQDYQMQLMLLEQQNKKRLSMAKRAQDQMQMPRAAALATAQQQQIQDGIRPQSQSRQALMQSQNAYAPPPPAAAPRSGGLFGSRSNPPPSASSLFGSTSLSNNQMNVDSGPTSRRVDDHTTTSEGVTRDALNDFDFDSFLQDGGDQATIQESLPALDFKDSLIEETGLTTAYELSGIKTLVPGSGSSKHRVARLSLANVAYNYTIVPKYKAVAYLKAKIRNTRKITLLRGQLGLTLDGSFMGRTALPRCSAGETLTLGMGIDPALKVRYPGPDVRRATTGLFSKEDSSIYTRLITLENTRSSPSSKAVTVFVHDQIPVSEDERLKVEVVQPHGLTVNGGSVKAGVAASEGVEGKDWGEATAIRKETGAVSWNVKLNPGKSVKLALEYVVAMPSGAGVTAISLK
ncbi:mucoidy inhibitor A [Sarocladium implicatum]|nr:mucoidy inhibitor A [Sarocladium implicatum]